MRFWPALGALRQAAQVCGLSPHPTLVPAAGPLAPAGWRQWWWGRCGGGPSHTGLLRTLGPYGAGCLSTGGLLCPSGRVVAQRIPGSANATGWRLGSSVAATTAWSTPVVATDGSRSTRHLLLGKRCRFRRRGSTSPSARIRRPARRWLCGDGAAAAARIRNRRAVSRACPSNNHSCFLIPAPSHCKRSDEGPRRHRDISMLESAGWRAQRCVDAACQVPSRHNRTRRRATRAVALGEIEGAAAPPSTGRNLYASLAELGLGCRPAFRRVAYLAEGRKRSLLCNRARWLPTRRRSSPPGVARRSTACGGGRCPCDSQQPTAPPRSVSVERPCVRRFPECRLELRPDAVG